MTDIVKSAGLFLLAGVCEIGGAYLIWQWRRNGQSALLALAGVVALFLYGLAQTGQPFNFGRAFAAYGGIFIVMAMAWGWWIDGRLPDRWDWLGAGVCLAGAAIILLARRP